MHRRRRRTLLAATLSPLLLVPVVPVAPAVGAESAPRRIVRTAWDSQRQLATGTRSGLTLRRGTLHLGEPAGVTGRYEYGSWTSPWVAPGFALTELVPSWLATTPGDSWVRVDVRGRTAAGTSSSWDTISRWALDDHQLRRTSGERQSDDLGEVAYDTWLARDLTSFQVRVTILRRAGSKADPQVRAVSAMVSRLPAVSSVATSTPGAAGRAALGTLLPVPRYSQMAHRGAYPQYDGGGEAWCSPTSTTMVLAAYGRLPSPAEYAWVRRDYPDRVVAHVARMTYDTSFGGTGNWPFNTAYAGSKTGRAFVTRLRSLREAELFVAAGIPLVASVTFGAGELGGAPISSTNGHLLVIRGFTRSGDVVVNDPAASSRAGVRRTYDRGQFEDAWLKRYRSGSSLRGSGGLVYVVSDARHPLPARDGRRNW